MTIVVIGPVCRDLIIVGDRKKFKTGGASYFQSFVFEKFYPDYLSIINCDNAELINDFPYSNKVKVLKKNNTHYFINEYPNPENLDIRLQYSNFARIAITVTDLKNILSDVDNIEAFILNPLNAFDFPVETINYLKSFNIPIFASVQGFLRYPSDKIDEKNYSIDLKLTENIKDKISNIDALFLDEAEASILFENYDLNIKELVITNGSRGSRIISDKEYKFDAVECENIVDSTGCGDTFMAAYISKKLNDGSIVDSANFASKIASEKLKYFGPFRL